jgi:GT2 family glycosyltransferase
VIPAFGSERRLLRCLDSVERELARSSLGRCAEVIVADDGTPGGFSPALRREHPRLRLLAADRRRGFAVNANRGVDAARGEVVCLLNSDMYPLPGFFVGCLDAFCDETIFAVTARILEPSGVDAGCKCLHLEGARVSVTGFDSAFAPFYWEDADLGYRAWKRGYRILYDATRALRHDHQGTIGHIGRRRVRRVFQRNRRRFVWHNNTSVGLLALFAETNLKPTLQALARLRIGRAVGLLGDAAGLPHAAAVRRASRRWQVLDDAALASLWKGGAARSLTAPAGDPAAAPGGQRRRDGGRCGPQPSSLA